ncbi:hypothetical protein C7M84_016856 [Penaeus vannamei]|uniref:Phosphoinositide phospholipase C n=1 Tax=Penaeus vannamei TaxID=6689 RepID=A0A423SLY4_PENVA|nr:hypothetical protein C7M84_016856 [Penaeus vannamei]
MSSLSESCAAKLAHTCPEELVNHNKNFLTRVYPNSSRVDSSNYNPQDFWNSGCQLVALNFQTPGQMMDVYEGKFRANGGCGYLIKPAVMREHISVFSANSRETIPGVAPQLLKIKIISGQCLPKPRGSTATKASFIDPYVVIQVFGIPADCTVVLSPEAVPSPIYSPPSTLYYSSPPLARPSIRHPSLPVCPEPPLPSCARQLLPVKEDSGELRQEGAALAKTRTVSNDSSFPIFDESFEFLINLPELAIVRFVVLDDEFIGDDFVGQCTVPFDLHPDGSCAGGGPLAPSPALGPPSQAPDALAPSRIPPRPPAVEHGRPMDNASLFVHVSISNRRGGGKPQRVKGRRADKVQADIKPVGLRAADDIFKEALASLTEAEFEENKVEQAWTDLQDECGLEHTANMKQCLKVTISRYMAHPDTNQLSIREENGIPFLRSSCPGPLPSHLHKLEVALEKVLLEIHHFLTHGDALRTSLESQLKPALGMYDNLESLLSSHGVKGKKANKATENFAWNVRIIRGQLDRLEALKKKCKMALEQVTFSISSCNVAVIHMSHVHVTQMLSLSKDDACHEGTRGRRPAVREVESTKATLDSLNTRERSPSVRERPRLTLANRHNTTENLTTYGSLGRSPTTPSGECKPKSILKKSNSNLESSSIGYVSEDYLMTPSSSSTVVGEDEDAANLLKPPLLHSFSYTPGFSYEQNTAL